ncbi:hypothetical protein [Leptolyngbya iicbica]|uniref:Uncharacterized protein n=1 Tax=Lyngbya confervoides BDU141951 TaxID=1574623 RepID=A0A8T6QPB0_9CYAN|nr:hypothetical protein [Leptolyngbya sp. LK]
MTAIDRPGMNAPEPDLAPERAAGTAHHRPDRVTPKDKKTAIASRSRGRVP